MELTENQKKDFMKKTAFIADNSTCLYKIGCVGVTFDSQGGVSDEAYKDPQFKKKEGLIYLKTWNETLPGEIYCQEYDDQGRKKICIRKIEQLKGKEIQKVCSIHAEANLISKCARYGISTFGMFLFITNTPCYICAKAIIQSGISELYYMDEHTEVEGLQLLEKNGVKCFKLEDVFS